MLIFKIAFRYLFSKKSTNAINIIAAVSMVGMGVGAFALITVLSTFNGFESLATSLYNSFYTDLTVTAVKGKTFVDDPALRKKLTATSTVAGLSRTLEENAYIKYVDKNYICTIKGVDDRYNDVTDVKSHIKIGRFTLSDSVNQYAVVGANVYAALNVDVERSIYPIQVTVPKKGKGTALMPEDAFTFRDVVPGGVFSIQQEFDSKYVFVSLGFAQELLGSDNEVSAYEIKLKPNADLEGSKEEMQKLVGKDFIVKTRYEQRETIYRVMRLERWAVYAILAFIMLIISFNIIGSLSMLVIEKRSDISILMAMGADQSLIRRIFLLEGVLSAAIGAVVGIILATILCLLQIKYEFLKLSGGENSFVIQGYPVKLKLEDYILTFFTVVVIALIASYFPAKRASEAIREGAIK
jgi:lipoprotein-releasing system permease protein